MSNTRRLPIERQEVFISCSASDKASADEVMQALRDANVPYRHNVYSNVEMPSRPEFIRSTLSSVAYVVILLSPHAIDDPAMEREWRAAISEEAKRRSITFVPIMIEDCEVPFEIKKYEALDFRDNIRQKCADLAVNLRKITWLNIAKMSSDSLLDMVYDLLLIENDQVWRHVRSNEFEIDFISEQSFVDSHRRHRRINYVIEVKQYKEIMSDISALGHLLAIIQRLRSNNMDVVYRGQFITNGYLSSVSLRWLQDTPEMKGGDISIVERDGLIRLLLKNPEVIDRNDGRR